LKYTSPAASPASEAAWIMPNEVRKDPAQFAIEIGLARPDRRHGRGDRRVFLGPVEPSAGQQLYRAAIEAGVHAVAVELDLVQPLVAFRRRVDELGQLRRDPLRQGRRVWTPRYRPHHAGGGNGLLRRRIRLVEMIDLADMLGMIPLPRSWSHSSSRSRLPPARSRRGNWIALAPPAANVRRCPVGL
jgi:hypothetical protein